MSTMTISTVSLAPRGLRGLRITARGRIFVGALVAAPIVGALVMASVAGPASAGSEQSTASFSTVTVQPGDSLWSIAERIAPQADPREVIAELEHLNALESASVAPGVSLAVPAAYAG